MKLAEHGQYLQARLICLCVLFAIDVASSDNDSDKPNVLVFGGNGFIGSTAIDKMLQEYPDASITIVNRHNWYWDSEKRIKPRVELVLYCDRQNNITDCKALVEFIESQKHFDVVVDFSAYTGHSVREVSQLLRNKVDLYFLISTDSVYDVCLKSHDGFSKEEDCVRPENDAEREELNRFNDYAHRKLQTEEVIIEQRLEEGGFNFIILRLPDVIGPRDGTYRWWIYQLWVKLAKEIPEKPIRIPKFLDDYPMSFVYVDDVAKLIVDLFKAPPQVRDQVINLAWQETYTMKDLLDAIEDVLLVQSKVVIDEERQGHFYMYPSVRKGPVAVEKVKSLVGWKTTPFKEAIKTTVDFYENAMVDKEFEQQRNEIVQVIGGHLYDDIRAKLHKTLEQVYGIELDHFKRHDEL